MKWLKAHSTVLSEAELIELLDEGKPFPRNASMITFDDGYRDNYELVYPVLRDLGLPATYFIPTLAIIEQRLGWWDLIAYLVKAVPGDRLIFSRSGTSGGPAGSDRRGLIRDLQRPPIRSRSLRWR